MLKKLSLQNFRNHKDFKLELDRLTIIVGLNGAGKSNCLEALSMLSVCRSFRDARKQDMISLDADFARIVTDKTELYFGRFPQFTLKGKIKEVPKRLTDFVGFIPAVTLSPETMTIITGAPVLRRRFMDIMVSQVDREYLIALVGFEKIKKQRNQLLKRIKYHQADISELCYWDKELAAFAEIISSKRQETVAFLNRFLTPTYRQIAGSDDANLAVSYLKNYDDLKDSLTRYRGRDIADERTHFGPHKDDLSLELDGRDMTKYASRGETKSAVLALKIGEMKFIEERRKARPAAYEKSQPILLLDDVFSEFDPERRRHLVELLGEYQAVVTTTDAQGLPEGIIKKAKIIKLK